jgi:hypothetical protein
MKFKFSLFIILSFAVLKSNAQKMYYVNDTCQFEIINDESKITNEMIFSISDFSERKKKPLYLVNNQEVYTIALYNKEEFKKIIVYQPIQAVKKFGKKGKNGAVLAFLRDEVKYPFIEILSNRIYYKCIVNNKMVDTTKIYYDKVYGENCNIVDLRDTSKIQNLYLGFDNIIKVKNLGAGWDRSTISISGGYLSGYSGQYSIRVKKEGVVKITITTAPLSEKVKTTQIICRAVNLPLCIINK